MRPCGEAAMVAVLTPAERAAFKGCRRAWDFESANRRNLEPAKPQATPDIDRPLRDALAVYYFPGMWDWSRNVVLPLVSQALDKGLERQWRALNASEPPNFEEERTAMRRLLDAYVEWAPGVERVAPVLVEVDYQADLADPEHPGEALRTPTGDAVRYCGRLDLLAIDEHDAYWIVRHLVVQGWSPLEALVRDEEALAACWAWEQHYLGMSITGTIHNELRVPAGFEPDPYPARPASSAQLGPGERGGVAQHEPSGGGRSVPQHRRLYAQSSAPQAPERVERDLGAWFRRTWIRRSRSEVDQAGRQLCREARELLDPDVSIYPSPASSRCPRCLFALPCQALYAGDEASPILASHYRARPHEQLLEGRLGGATWSSGRGAAPVRFRGRGA
jgi:hypothetical protein